MEKILIQNYNKMRDAKNKRLKKEKEEKEKLKIKNNEIRDKKLQIIKEYNTIKLNKICDKLRINTSSLTMNTLTKKKVDKLYKELELEISKFIIKMIESDE